MYNITTNSIMSQIPEELLQQIMQMTGMNRKDAESELLKSIQEMSKNIGSKSVPGVKNVPRIPSMTGAATHGFCRHPISGNIPYALP